MVVYDRAVRTVTLAQRLELYNVYIAKAAEFFGVTKTRDIYEQAIAALPPAHVADMCIRYANLERKLGEVDRARLKEIDGRRQAAHALLKQVKDAESEEEQQARRDHKKAKMEAREARRPMAERCLRQ